jgi:hypothetical protein
MAMKESFFFWVVTLCAIVGRYLCFRQGTSPGVCVAISLYCNYFTYGGVLNVCNTA